MREYFCDICGKKIPDDAFFSQTNGCIGCLDRDRCYFCEDKQKGKTFKGGDLQICLNCLRAVDDVPSMREILLDAWKKEVAQNPEQDPLRILYPPTKNDGPFVRLQRSADQMKDRRAIVQAMQRSVMPAPAGSKNRGSAISESNGAMQHRSPPTSHNGAECPSPITP